MSGKKNYNTEFALIIPAERFLKFSIQLGSLNSHSAKNRKTELSEGLTFFIEAHVSGLKTYQSCTRGPNQVGVH